MRNENKLKVGFWIAIALFGLVFVSLAFTSCTIAPQVTQSGKPSPWATTNIVGHDLKGYFVTSEWIRVYHGLIKAYGDKLPINEQVPADDMTGIVPTGHYFHVSFETNKRFTDLKYIENGT